jgi:hypothetical protein
MSAVIFDKDDISALLTMSDLDKTVLRFTPAEMRRQIHAAEVNESVCRTFGEDAWAFVYEDLGKAMALALDVLRSQQPKPKSMPGRARVDVAALKERSDIVEVAGRYTTLRKAGARFVGACPLHEDRTPSFTVYPNNGSWYCFSCNRGGDIVDLVKLAEHVDFKEAVVMLR